MTVHVHYSTTMFHECYVSADKEILAEWPEEKMQLRCAVTQAVQCACKIQDMCKILRTTEDQRQPVKIGAINRWIIEFHLRLMWFNMQYLQLLLVVIAISVERFSIVRLGDQESGVCFVIGPAVDKILSAVALADHCDIVLSPETWRLCNLQNLTIEHIGSEGAVKVGLKPHQTDFSEFKLS